MIGIELFVIVYFFGVVVFVMDAIEFPLGDKADAMKLHTIGCTENWFVLHTGLQAERNALDSWTAFVYVVE